MIGRFKFLTKYEHHRFSHYCCYDNAKYILETLTNTDEWQTTIFPKEYEHPSGKWRVLYIQQGTSNFHSVICHVPNNPGHIIERFCVNIEL